MTTHDHDDAGWQELLRASSPVPPVDEVDWAAFHDRTSAAAVPLLHRRSMTWWQLLGGWSSRGRRTAAVAAAVGMLLLTGVLMPERPAGYDGAEPVPTLEEELAGSLPYASVPLLAADAPDADVLAALLLFDGEER